jgi:hypothetical protein
MTYTATAKAEAKEYLQKLLSSGDVFARDGKPVIYTGLESVSRSGMSRVINVYVCTKSGGIERISYWAARLLGVIQNHDNCGLKVSGCGMDMGYHIVNSLSMALYCPDKYTHDGAYQLLHEWI